MWKPPSNLLLAGALMIAVPAVAQSARPAQANGMLEVAITYDATMSNVIAGSRFWMQGGGVQVNGQFYRGLGVVGNVSAAETANTHSSGAGLTLVTSTFGPRYTFTRGRYAFFGQALGGVVNGLNSVFPNPQGATSSQSGFATQAGGGVTVGLSPHLAIRAFQADWLRTQLPNAATNVQNNLQLAAGVVFRFK